jgi:putative nucleotidyltransferase with HDIG domain
MFNRVKQLIAALTARITADDMKFISQNLTVKEQELFGRMNLPDQRHALNVAYTALELAKKAQINVVTVLIKSALLHDIGKVKGDVSTVDKMITVIAHTLAPDWAEKWGRQGRGSKLANLRHAFYIYFHHAARSAILLQEIGTSPQITEIVVKHHQTPTADDPAELTILRQADNLH